MNIHDTHPMGEVPEEHALVARIAARLGISQPQAEQVAGAVLGELEQHLNPLEAEGLEAALPVLLRRAIHRVEGGPARERFDTSHQTTAEEFYRGVAGRLHTGVEAAHPLAMAVFECLRPDLSDRVREQVSSRLSPDMQALWQGNL